MPAFAVTALRSGDTDESQAPQARLSSGEVADGTRTHDHLDHNQGLYQLSYSHRAGIRIAGPRRDACSGGYTMGAAKPRRTSRVEVAANAGFAGVRHCGYPAARQAAANHHGRAKRCRICRGSAPGRIRTSDPRLRRPPLCPLSYRRRRNRLSRRWDRRWGPK
jgi:hypothetical protein